VEIGMLLLIHLNCSRRLIPVIDSMAASLFYNQQTGTCNKLFAAGTQWIFKKKFLAAGFWGFKVPS
jgi:hypothetical protein